jgi:hypothetical protein
LEFEIAHILEVEASAADASVDEATDIEVLPDKEYTLHKVPSYQDK